MNLEVSSVVDGATGRVLVKGEVDVSNADALRNAVSALLERDGVERVEVDLGQVPYIDSTGIGVLVGATHRAAEVGREVRAVNVQANVARIFGMLGVDEIVG